MKNLFDFKIILPVLVAMVIMALVISPMLKANGNNNDKPPVV